MGSYQDQLCLCGWDNPINRNEKERKLCEALKTTVSNESSDVIAETMIQLDEYFVGRRVEFTLPLLMIGTDFQKKVWETLQIIPFGESWSYQDVANHIGNPKAVRAVGSANGANPVSIIVPCHRVVTNDGKLGGFGGGLDAKKFLLELECATFHKDGESYYMF